VRDTKVDDLQKEIETLRNQLSQKDYSEELENLRNQLLEKNYDAEIEELKNKIKELQYIPPVENKSESDSDIFYSWFLSNYESVPESDIHVHSYVRLRELVEQYRIENQIRDSVTKLVDKLSNHRVLKKFLKDRHRFYDNGKQAEVRNVLFGIRRVVDDLE
jgi:DNA repair exonuclease SbcCD ATPase subunit